MTRRVVVPRLTKEQAAIVGAYTGFLAGPFEDVHAYADVRLARLTWNAEFGSETFAEELQAACKDDFLAIAYHSATNDSH